MLQLERFVLDKDTPDQINKKATGENVLCVIADSKVRNELSNDLWFYIRTYQDIYRDKVQQDAQALTPRYSVILAPANDFLSTLIVEEQKHVYATYHVSKKYLETISNDNQIDVLHKIGSVWSNVVNALQLDQKAVNYVRNSSLPIPESSKKTTDKAHHKKEITFYYEDYVYSIAISIIIKMLIPILGDVITRICQKYVNNTAKETYAAIILYDIFEGSAVLRSTYEKLGEYVSHTVRKIEKDRSSDTKTNTKADYANMQRNFTYSLHGYTPERMIYYLFSQVLVKKLATINYYINNGSEKSDLMKYLFTSIKNSHQSSVSTLTTGKANAENSLAVRNDTDMDMEKNEEVKDTNLEQSSRISNQPADRSMFINHTAGLAVKKHLIRNNMSVTDHEKACAFYERNLQNISPLTNALVSSYMGYCVGGPSGIRYLSLKHYIPLLAATQLMLASRNFVNIVHLFTSISRPKTAPFTSIESSLQQNYKVSNEYIQCMTLYPYALGKNKDGVNRIGIEKQIDVIVNWIIENDHYHRTAPTIQKYLTEDPVPNHNTPIQYEERVIANICSVILDLHQE